MSDSFFKEGFRFQWILAFCLPVFVVLAFATQTLWKLGTPSLWVDEAASWDMVNGSWSHHWETAVAGEDCLGFLYSTLLRGWVHWAGTSEVALRLPSVLLSMIALVFIYRIARHLWGRVQAFWSLALAASCPLVTLYAREARAYALVFAASTLLLWGWCRVMDQQVGERSTGYFWVILGGLGLVWSFGLGGLLVLGIFFSSWTVSSPLWRPGEKWSRRFFPSLPLMVVGILGLIWLWQTRQRVRTNLATWWLQDDMFRAWLNIGKEFFLPIVIAALVMVIFGERQADGKKIGISLILMALPVFVGPLVISWFGRGHQHYIVPRYFISLVPLAALSGGWLISLFRRPWCIWVGIGILAFNVYRTQTRFAIYAETSLQREAVHSASMWLKKNMRSGDILWVEPFWAEKSFLYYGIPTATRQSDGHWVMASGSTHSWSTGSVDWVRFWRVWFVKWVSPPPCAPQGDRYMHFPYLAVVPPASDIGHASNCPPTGIHTETTTHALTCVVEER